MKDPEFYTISEEWPQPPDESCTLQDERTAAGTAKPKKRRGRVRKKISESLAGVTAAAVAVVMLVSALPSLKDAFGDLPDFGLSSGVCYYCGEENCPYSFEGEPGLILSYPGQVEYLEYDLYQMNGFTDRDRDNDTSCYIITTETKQRLILEIDAQLFDGVDRGGYWSEVLINTTLWNEGKPAASGVCYQIVDDKSGEYINTVYLYLAYSPDGDFSALDLEEDLTGLDFRAFPVEDVPNAQIQVYTDLGEEFISIIEANCHVEVLQEQLLRYPLGDTMYLQENDAVYRTFNDENLSYVRYYMGAEDGEYLYWHFMAGFYIKLYGLNDAEISFASSSWVDIFREYEELNADAAGTGHKVCFPIQNLGETSVNDITYRCYAAYMNDGSEGRDMTFLCVPLQEPEILIHFREGLSEEELEALLSGKINADYLVEQYVILSQVTLR